MKRAIFFLILGLMILGLAPWRLHSQLIVKDAMRVIMLGKEIYEEGEFFKSEIESFKQEIEHITKSKQFGKAQDEYYENRYNKFDNIVKMFGDYINGFKVFRRRVEMDFPWDKISLKDIDDILKSPLFQNSGSDPYQGLFTQGTQLSSVFTDVNYNDNILNSEVYQNNEYYREYLDKLMEEEKRTISDVESRKNVLAGVTKMQNDSEAKLRKIEKQMHEIATMTENATYMQGKYADLSNFLAISMESNLEMAREVLQQIIVKKNLVEILILNRIRESYLQKLESIRDLGDYQARIDKEKETVMESFGVDK